MTDDRLPLAELLQKAGDGDFLRAVAEAVLQLLMEADVEGLIGAGRHERSAERLNYRNGFRDRTLDTRLGSLQLRIPKLRQGSLDPLCGSSPAVLGAAQDQREGVGGGDPRGLDRRRFDAAGGRAGASDGAVGHLQIHRLEAVPRHRRAGRRLPRPAAGGRVAR